jgi:prepilin-type N-terminal cleavage/methylation domain-containing protein
MKTSPLHTATTGRRLFRSNQGFTLIELLMVIAVIMILAGITFGVSRGVYNAQARTKAKAELATLAQGLEQFKSTYGDYPWVSNTATSSGNITENGSRLLLALGGWMQWNYEGGTKPVDLRIRRDFTPPLTKGDSYIDLAKFSVNKELSATAIPEGYWPLDPWGQPYVFAYRGPNTTSWDNFGYVLYSMGPDGVHAPASSIGIQDQTAVENLDNIYSGQ